MTSNLYRLESLSKTEKRQAAELLAAAFAEERLLNDYYLLDVGARYQECLLYLMTHAVNHGLLYGEVYATSPQFEGLAIWYPPTYSGPTVWKDIRAGGMRLLFKTGWKVIQRMNAHLEYSDTVFKQHVGGSWAKGRGWLLWMLAVAPAHQKQGCASQLVRPMLQRIDGKGHLCYLDTQNEENLAIYEHYGFEVVGTGRIPGTDIPHWLLKREPAATAI